MKTQQTASDPLNLRLGGRGRCQPPFASEAPWALAKTNPERQGTVLYVTAEILRQVGILAQPLRRHRPRNCSTCSLCPHRTEFSALTAERASGGGDDATAGPVFPRYIEAEEKA